MLDGALQDWDLRAVDSKKRGLLVDTFKEMSAPKKLMSKAEYEEKCRHQAHRLEPGDWLCPACADRQFAWNASCRKCGTPYREVPL